MKKTLTKRMMAAALSILMMLGLMPMTTSAAVTSVPGAKGHILEDILTLKFTAGYDSTLFVYGTPRSYSTIEYNLSDNAARVHIPNYDSNEWYFAGWRTWYQGSWSGLGVTNSNTANPSRGDGGYYFEERTTASTVAPVGTMYVYKETLWKGTYYLSAIFEPLVTINVNDGVSYTVSGGSMRADDTYSTQYNSGMLIDYSTNDGYIVTGVSANYGTSYSDDGDVVSLTNITRPATVNINARLKQQKVNFNANGGEGTMAAQTFEHSVAQALSANGFTRKGYTFAGWSTASNGSGTAYADKASATFAPKNDGDSITLYAQWTQCTDHNWVDGECTKCFAQCSHSGGSATCTELATCSTCNEEYGELAKHNVVYDSSSNRIVETCSAGCGHTATADLVLDSNVSTVYTGSAIEALKVTYSDNWQGGNLEITYSDNVNAGTASGSISIGGKTATQDFEITKVTMTGVSAQGYNGTYDGQPHGITVNAPEGATVSYKVGDGEYTTVNPSFTDAGSYTVAYKVSKANHTDVKGTAEVNIGKAPLTVVGNDHNIKYGEAPANNGVTYSGFVAGETASVLGGTLTYDYTYAVGDNIGPYEIAPMGLTSDNYEITFVNGILTVDKADVTYTAPTANNLTYTGGMQELVTAGTVNGGTMVFSFDKEGGYSETISAKEKGDYTVWYKVIGDNNHNDSVPASVSVEIKQAKPDLGTVSVSGTVYDTTAPKDVVLVRTNTDVRGTLSIVKADDFMRADKTEYTWEFVPEDVKNYEVVYGTVAIDVVDTVAPTVSVSIRDHKWTLWDTVTFGLFYNESKQVTITYADNENGSGLKDMLYYVANKEMSVEELQTVQWTAYTEAFDLDPDGKYVVYAKAVDNDGNTVIVNSGGHVLDKTQAVVEGLTNGGIYYGQLVFTVADELAGVKSVVIDGADKTHFEGQYVINGDNAEHTVTVTDNAGNKTEYAVIVYRNYTVTYKADGETVSTQTVGHGKDATAPEIPEKVGYTQSAPVWDKDGKNITADTEINAVYTINKYTVSVPSTQTGYTLTVDKTEFEHMGGPTITLNIHEGYSKTENFAVKLNGMNMQWGDYTQIGTQHITEDLVITVEGVADITAPSAEITLGTNKWNRFWNNVTFGLFFKETQSITITAKDKGSEMDDDAVYYYLADKELTEDEVKAITDWKPYDGAFSVNPDNEYIIYAKAVDKDGNAAYLNSEGIVLDSIVPVISGVEDGAIYHTTQKLVVTDDNPDTVTVNGEKVTGDVLLDGDVDTTYTVVATDKSGNATTVTVYMKTIDSVNESIKDITDKDVTSGDKEDVQVVIDKVEELLKDDDLTDEEKKALEEIKGKADDLREKIEDAAEATDTENTEKVEDVTSENVTPDDKTDLEKAKAALEELKKPVADTDSPQTGDNSNMALWFALLIMSVVAILSLSVYEHKRKLTGKR